MQREVKSTKVTVRADCPTSITSTLYGANIGVLAFNTEYIAVRDPVILYKLMKLYEKATALRDKKPLDKNDERFNLITDKLIQNHINPKNELFPTE